MNQCRIEPCGVGIIQSITVNHATNNQVMSYKQSEWIGNKLAATLLTFKGLPNKKSIIKLGEEVK